METPRAGQDEVWTVGRARAYLNGGPVDFHLTAKLVREMAQDPGCQIRPISGGTAASGRPRWFRLLASTVRAERARLLRAAGFDDPDWPAGGGGAMRD